MQKKPLHRPVGRSRYHSLIVDADRFFAAKDYEVALQIYQQALKEAPVGQNYAYAQICRCYRQRARGFLKQQDWPALIAVLEEMIQINGDRPHLKSRDFQVLAEAYLEVGQLEKAAIALEQALTLNPEGALEIQRIKQRLKAEQLHQGFRQLF